MKIHFYLVLHLLLLTPVHSVSLCDLYNMFLVYLNIFSILLHSDKFGVFKWVLGQESHPYELCLGATFQGHN